MFLCMLISEVPYQMTIMSVLSSLAHASVVFEEFNTHVAVCAIFVINFYSKY